MVDQRRILHGGWVAQAVTAVAGSSAWFDRGFVTYSNPSKMEQLGSRPPPWNATAPCRKPPPGRWRRGALAHSRADWSLAITGIAGPSGGSPEKPVGTVCFAWAQRDGGCEAQTCRFAGDRAAVRAQSVRHALQGLLERLDASPPIALKRR